MQLNEMLKRAELLWGFGGRFIGQILFGNGLWVVLECECKKITPVGAATHQKSKRLHEWTKK